MALQFLVADNLCSKQLEFGEPWNFNPGEAELKRMRELPKSKRRATMLHPSTKWQVYTALRGADSRTRISNTDPPVAMNGIVLDYDAVSNDETVEQQLETIPEEARPNYVETSLGGKRRLIWIFEREVMVTGMAYATAFIMQFVKTYHLDVVIAGYDAASAKSTQMWTNGVEWQPLKETPLSKEICFGIEAKIVTKTELFGVQEVPMDVVAAEVEERFPGRWKGEFTLGAKGLRFWDPVADNPTGCQVCPDGMKCFTGPKPFMSWADIFTRQWVEDKKVLHLGRAGADFIWDGRNFWSKPPDGKFWIMHSQEHHVESILCNRGLSPKVNKGQTISEVKKVMTHIREANLVASATPYVNRAPGLFIDKLGKRRLNTAMLSPVYPKRGESGDPSYDCPLIYPVIEDMLRTGARISAFPYFLAHMKRSYDNTLNHKNEMGQWTFLCGPPGTGKTLILMKVIVPLLGNRCGFPFRYLIGSTDFNDDLLSAGCLISNDDEAPTDQEKKKYEQRLKGFVVNPEHKYHQKFRSADSAEWTGRGYTTLNNDPASCRQLPEINENTVDKFMFFLITELAKKHFLPRAEMEAKIEAQLPAFGYWLLYDFQPPIEVYNPADPRTCVRSYFDETLLAYSQHQTPAHDLKELLQIWFTTSADAGVEIWEGNPTQLLTQLSAYPDLAPIVMKKTQKNISENLTTLSRIPGSGVYGDASTHRFKIVRAEVLIGYNQ
jgi:hypothetical protein